MAEGEHPVPSRTRKLSPPAPMVLLWRRSGRVGRCRDFLTNGPPARAARSLFRTLTCMSGAFQKKGRGGPRAAAPIDGLPRAIQEEIRRTAPPGKERDAMSRLARAIELLDRDDPKAARGGGREGEGPRPSLRGGPRGARTRALRARAMAGGAHGAQGVQADQRPRRPEPPDRGQPPRARPAGGGRPSRRGGAPGQGRPERGEGRSGDRRRVGARGSGAVRRGARVPGSGEDP